MAKRVIRLAPQQMPLGLNGEREFDLLNEKRCASIRALGERNIFIGTSGYSYEDWVGPFYPPGTKKPQMLEYLARWLPCVELNFSYYSMPTAQILHQIARKAPKMKFSVKAHQSITHQRTGEPESWKAFAEALEPLRETGRLASVLFQFPFSFHRSQESIDYIVKLRDFYERHPVVFEFRHAGWFSEELYAMLRKLRAGICSVDAPRLKGLTSNIVRATNRQGYYRLHGRNAQNWFDGDNVTRYDYTYSPKEIVELAANVSRLAETTEEVFVYANNHPKGQAIETAVALAEELQKRTI